jgi:dihydroxyacetone kinase DhaKLM complex PTS-EIIA-like component DhaM
MDLTWKGDEPSTAMAEEDSAAAAEESAPAPQAETEAPAVEAMLSEASIVEGGYTAQTQSSSGSSRSHQGRLIQMSSVDRGRSRGKHHP